MAWNIRGYWSFSGPLLPSYHIGSVHKRVCTGFVHDRFSDSSAEIISFAIIISFIQLIESYVLEPLPIGSEVEQSPLFIIIAIVLGGMLWGPSGLILFVPIFGILKIIFDHNPSLRPVGFLIGYERPGSGEGIFEKLKKKLKK